MTDQTRGSIWPTHRGKAKQRRKEKARATALARKTTQEKNK